MNPFSVIARQHQPINKSSVKIDIWALSVREDLGHVTNRV